MKVLSCTEGEDSESPSGRAPRVRGARGVIRETTRGVTGTSSGHVAR